MSKPTSLQEQSIRLSFYISGSDIHTLGQMSKLLLATFVDEITINLNNIFSNQIQKQEALHMFNHMIHSSCNSYNNKSLEVFNENKKKLIDLLEKNK